ncbi:MAG: mechanosensitive ion channel family protein [Myxococcota bacterium]
MRHNHPLRWMLLGLAALLFVGSILLPVLVNAAGPTGAACKDARTAADSLFVMPAAQTCLDASDDTRAQLAKQLRQILDARGLRVPVESLSDDPDWTPEEGPNRIQPLPSLAPWLTLTRTQDGRWLYSRDTLIEVPALHAQTFSATSLWLQAQLPEAFQQKIPLVGGKWWQVAFAAILIVVSLLIGLIVRFVVMVQIRSIAKRLKLPVDAKRLRSLDAPVMVLIMTALAAWRLPDLQLPISISPATYLILSIVLGLSGVMVASRLADLALGFWAAKTEATESKLDDQLVPLLRQVSFLVVWAVGILFVLQNNGVQVWSFVAGLGIGSLAFALAAQDTVANLFGAANIFLDKPFQIGDVVQVGDVEGTVEEVGFRSFRVRTFYNSVVTVPNSTITTANVDNLGVRVRRRCKLTLGLTYDTPPDTLQAFVEGVRAVLAAHPKVVPNPEVHFNAFSGSSLDILVYYHIVTDSWTEELRTRNDNFLEFLRLAEAMGVQFAFPTTSLMVESTPEHPMSAPDRPSFGDLTAIAHSFGPNGERSRPHGPGSSV